MNQPRSDKDAFGNPFVGQASSLSRPPDRLEACPTKSF
jgi:hypothetical protein